MRVLNIIVNKFITDNVLKAAYLEKALNEKYEDIHLHLIFKTLIDKNDIFKIIKSLLDDATYITYYVIKDEVLHIVSEDNLSIYFYVDTKNYRYKNKVYLYNPSEIDNDENLNLDNPSVIKLMTLHIHEFINEIHNTYNFFFADEKTLALVSLNKSVEYLFKFLSCYYLVSPYNHSFNDVLDAMEKEKRSELEKIIRVISLFNVLECAKMLIWFIDYYINGLPITITKEVDIDFYLYVKKLIIGVGK